MKITIDLRSLSSGSISGVENYTINTVEGLLALDKKNEYSLFYNAFDTGLSVDYHYINSRLVRTKIPNKILNIAFKLGLVNLEKFVGNTDWVFMPNLNQFSLMPSTRLALTVHDISPVVAPEFYNLKRRTWHWFLNYKKAFDRANLIFAVSEYTKQDIITQFGIRENKIKVVHPGLDTEIYKPQIKEQALRELRNLLNLPPEFFLFLNTIEPRKNLENLLKAFEMLSGPEYLVIAGRKGWKNKRIFSLIEKSKRRKKIILLGYVQEDQKPALIKMSKALVYPSFYEGFGFQPVEAMALGVPVIASQVTALPEVVGDAGVLVNPYNPLDIARAMKGIVEEKSLAEELVLKGLERAGVFGREKSAKKILDYLENYV
ncbi:MAG: glycosyltransferase family 4 protein [Candidatus Doudnabacteria bacterium]|nr:glycosyltransferase family 4 protein [Candidatus Doudnabacteria bacterium]